MNEKDQDKNEFNRAQAEFFSHRLKNRLRKHLFRILGMCVILGAGALAAVRSVEFVKRADLFVIHDVVVKGNRTVKYGELLEAADLEAGEKNIFRIDLKGLRKKLLLHPRIKEVALKRELPGRLHIEVAERSPVALINMKNGPLVGLYEADEEGFLIGQDPYLSETDLPVITSDGETDAALGERIKDREILEVLEALSRVNREVFHFNRLVAEVHVRRSGEEADIILYLNFYNVKILFGKSFGAGKLKKLNSLLIAIGGRVRDLEYIDFKFNEAVGKYRI